MNSAEDKVIHLRERDAEGALERLNRITGLRFARWPQSLAPLARQAACELAECAASESVERSVESA
jgi:hypothetical protein